MNINGNSRSRARRFNARQTRRETSRWRKSYHDIIYCGIIFYSLFMQENDRTGSFVHPPCHYVALCSRGRPRPSSIVPAPAGQILFMLALTSANEEAIILRYVSNGWTRCTVTTRLSLECWLAANDPPSCSFPSRSSYTFRVPLRDT